MVEAMKAFLSHSSKDKEFVKAVALELGRQFCILDEQAFSSGIEFKESILKGLDESSIFVLFFSKSAKDSIWVHFETDEAWYKKLEGRIKKTLVYVIDSEINLTTDLPEWLKRGRVVSENIPKAIARDIRFHLNEFIRERQHSLFLNRDTEKESLVDSLKPIDLSVPPPRVVFIHGLPGIGRKSFIRQFTPNLLNLKKFVEFRLGSGDSLNDICAIVADKIEPYNTSDGLKTIVNEIRALPEDNALTRLKNNLTKIVANGELPIFIDDGGLLDNEGYFQPPIKKLLNALAPHDDIYIFFVSDRKPQFTDEYYPTIQLNRLPLNDTKRLLAELARLRSLKPSLSEIEELASYIAGYPPAAYFSITEAKTYGISALLKEKENLIKYRTSVFIKHFASINLSSDEKKLLSALAFYSPLPINAVVKILGLDDLKAVDVILRLIDYSFITVTDEGHYRIADPISDAVMREFGMPSEEQSQQVAQHLSEFLSDNQLTVSLLEISRVLFRAARISKNKDAEKISIHLANDLVKLTVNSYHLRHYEEAISFGKAALEERPDNGIARSYLIRAYIQNEQWKNAEEEIEKFKKYTALKEIYFLKGFLERHRRKNDSALIYYREAEKLGRGGVDIQRELAHCLFHTGDIDSADTAIKKILGGREGDNVFVVDLWAQIATAKNDEAEVNSALERLKLLDEFRYYFRLSIYQGKKRDFDNALKSARESLKGDNRPPFKIRAHFVDCLIKSGQLNDAREEMDRLDKDFGVIQRDIRLSLRCQLENKAGHYKEALRLCERIARKGDMYYKKIRKDAIEGELRVSALTDAERRAFNAELSKLSAELLEHDLADELPLD